VHSVHLTAGDGIEGVLQEAMLLRTSEETERNSASSRSHAVCTLRIAGNSAGRESGTLRLVDLAGSERNYETTRMTAQQHRDFAEINTSLMVLKDCFRAHAALQRGEKAKLPLRRSQLTQVLRACFQDLSHKTVVIAAVSPSATDVIHTLNTLRHATMLAKPLEDLTHEVTVELPLHLGVSKFLMQIPVVEWSAKDVIAWLSEGEQGRFAHLVVPPNLTGEQLLSTSAEGLSDLFEGTMRRARVDHEGTAWNVQVDNLGADIGRDLFRAARRVALEQDNSRRAQLLF